MRGSSTGRSARRPRISARGCRARRWRRLCGCGSCHRDEPSISTTAGGYARNASAREHIANDLALDLVRLLSSASEIERRADDGTPLGREPVRPGHVAVLVQTNRTAAQIRDALEAVDIPAVINGAGSVFGTAPAREWLRLLEAIERPTYVPARPLGRADAVLRLERRADGVRRRGGVVGGPPAPARLGARAAGQGHRVAHRDDHAARRIAAADPRDGRWRARPDRPAPHRPAAARGRGHRAARHDGAGGVAAAHGSPRRRRTRATRTAAAASSRTPRRCRC